jgi:hypothetical protein
MKQIADFYAAWQFLETHPMFQYGESSMLHHCLEIEVVKVNPKTNRIDDDERENTATRVWMECGPYLRPEELSAEERRHLPYGIPSVDLQLSCGAPTFEEAIIKLANRVARRYGRSRHPRRRLRKTLTREERAVRKAYREHRAGKGRPAEEVWAELRRYGARQARRLGLKATEVGRLVKAYRKGR